jgi:hypothetical protein
MMTRLTHFSVIVPVYNGAETLDDCLTALVNQDYPRDNFEIIVVDDGSTDDTAQMASRYPVRLVSLETNQGRVVARNAGAQAAKYETLVFNDVRVVPERQLLTKVCKRNYQPLIPNVHDYDGSRWGFGRLFYLLRSRIYAPYYPLSEGPAEFQITPENFGSVPKGTTNLVCDRGLWLTCQPEIVDRSTNDDTRILRRVVEHRPILRTRAMTVEYRQRTALRDVVVHAFERGPRFADYYLHPGGRYYLPYLVAWSVLGLIILGTVVKPALGILGGGLLLLLGSGIAALYLSQAMTDFAVVLICLPIIASAFGLGILKWQIAQLLGSHES